MAIEPNIITQAKELLAEIQSVCADFKLHSLLITLRSINNFADQNQYLDVAVLGQFKAGKSSFLNAYLDKDLLPVGDIPVTSVISRIRYGKQEKATVTFLDGNTRIIAIQAIPDYVSESGNPGNIKQVRVLDLEVPALQNIQALRLVDTPGIGSVWQHNTETTTSWFPETGGVLFVISAERPISENELGLLQEIYLYSPEIAIVITKTDLFTEDHLQQIELFIAKVLRNAFNQDFPILRYSAYKDTCRYNTELEQRIFQPFALNRDKKYASILRHKIGSLANSCLTYLNISYQASLQQDSEKGKLKATILDEHLNSPFVRRELLLISGSYKEKTRENIKVYLDSFRKELETKLSQEYARAFGGWKGNLYVVTRQFEHWLNQSLHSELQEILLNEEKSFELLSTVKKHLAFYLKSFRERLSHNLEQVLGVQPQLEQWEINIGELERPDISVSRAFDFHLDLLWFLFPMVFLRNIFRRHFVRQIPKEVDKNLHRLTSDLNQKINNEIDNLIAQALTYMNQEINLIETLLTEQRGDSAYIQQRINSIEYKFRDLEKKSL
ncbi:MAG: dynamin family protein [Syntrophomonas sp.]|nr:dynamin family protein [Syntrophomonas sp.]